MSDYEACFREQYPRLVALGVSMCGDREVARELAQETMLRAHGRWAAVSEYDAVAAWLRRVMVNLLIDHHRSRTAEASAVVRLATRPAQSDGSVEVEWGALVALLPPRQRIVVTLFYGEDMSIQQIADEMGIRVGTVKSALAKARQRLASKFGDVTGDADEGGSTR